MGLVNRALILYRDAGLGAILKQVLVALRIYENNHYYLYSTELKLSDNESRYLPKIDINNITYEVFVSRKQLDKLILRGFKFVGYDLDYLKYVISKGVWVDFLFVGKELAFLCLTATTKEAKDTFDSKPYKIDFSNNESCSFAWTNPKYRNQGLATYHRNIKSKNLLDRGIKRTRTTVRVSNTAIMKVRAKFPEDAAPYATAHFLRVLGFGFWKETPLNKS